MNKNNWLHVGTFFRNLVICLSSEHLIFLMGFSTFSENPFGAVMSKYQQSMVLRCRQGNRRVNPSALERGLPLNRTKIALSAVRWAVFEGVLHVSMGSRFKGSEVQDFKNKRVRRFPAVRDLRQGSRLKASRFCTEPNLMTFYCKPSLSQGKMNFIRQTDLKHRLLHPISQVPPSRQGHSVAAHGAGPCSARGAMRG